MEEDKSDIEESEIKESKNLSFEEKKEEPKKTAIEVPMGCYAVITPKTPSNIQALFTDGLHTCSGIVVKTTNGDYTFLCHAHALNDLIDDKFGIPAWIEQIQQTYATIKSILVRCDDTMEGFYSKIIGDLIEEKKRTEKNWEKVGFKCDKIGANKGLKAYRNGEIEASNDVFTELKENGYKIEASDIVRYRYDIDKNYETKYGSDKKIPPICIFDGNNFLSIEEIQKRYKFVDITPFESPDNSPRSNSNIVIPSDVLSGLSNITISKSTERIVPRFNTRRAREYKKKQDKQI